MGTSVDELWSLLIKWRMNPITNQGCLRSDVHCEEDGTIVCTKTFDADYNNNTLRQYAGEEAMQLWQANPELISKTQFWRDQGLIMRQVYLSDEITQSSPKDCIRIHEAPIVVECWRVTKCGHRHSGPILKDFLAYLLN